MVCAISTCVTGQSPDNSHLEDPPSDNSPKKFPLGNFPEIVSTLDNSHPEISHPWKVTLTGSHNFPHQNIWNRPGWKMSILELIRFGELSKGRRPETETRHL